MTTELRRVSHRRNELGARSGSLWACTSPFIISSELVSLVQYAGAQHVGQNVARAAAFLLVQLRHAIQQADDRLRLVERLRPEGRAAQRVFHQLAQAARLLQARRGRQKRMLLAAIDRVGDEWPGSLA